MDFPLLISGLDSNFMNYLINYFDEKHIQCFTNALLINAVTEMFPFHFPKFHIDMF